MDKQSAYEDILENMRQMIPQLTDEWTNYNLQDPGWMLLELFAFLLDILRYRISLIGERQQWKYLELLGFCRSPVKAARAVLQVRAKENRLLLPGARIWAEDICFEAEHSRYLLKDDIAACLFFREGQWRKVDRIWMQKTDSMRIHLFGRHPACGACFYLVFDQPLPVGEEILIYADILEPEKIKRNQIRDREEFFPLVRLEYAVYTKTGYEAVNCEDETCGFLQDGWLRLHIHRQMEYVGKGILQTDGYYLRVRMAGGSYDLPPVLKQITANAVSVRQRYRLAWLTRCKAGDTGQRYLFREENEGFCLAKNEDIRDSENETVFWSLEWEKQEGSFPLVGTGRGDSGQAYPLPPYQLEEEGFEIFVETGMGTDFFRPWGRVKDFCSSLPEDCHYILSQEEDCLKFGDGIRGRAPRGRIFVVNCAGCEGSRGNVSGGTICRPEEEGLIVWNREPAKGGGDTERLEDCIKRYEEWNRQGQELVSLRDYERAVMETPGLLIEQCRAVPGTDGEGGCLKLAVCSGADGGLSEEYKKNILCHIEKRRLLGLSVLLCEPVYVGLTVYLRWKGQESGEEKIREALEDYLEKFCSDFGGRLYAGKISSLAENAEEVAEVTEVFLEPMGKGAVRLSCGDVDMWPQALLNRDRLALHIRREG